MIFEEPLQRMRDLAEDVVVAYVSGCGGGGTLGWALDQIGSLRRRGLSDGEIRDIVEDVETGYTFRPIRTREGLVRLKELKSRLFEELYNGSTST